MTIIHSPHSPSVNAHDAFFRELGETIISDTVSETIFALHPGTLNHPHCNPGLPLKTDKAEMAKSPSSLPRS